MPPPGHQSEWTHLGPRTNGVSSSSSRSSPRLDNKALAKSQGALGATELGPGPSTKLAQTCAARGSQRTSHGRHHLHGHHHRRADDRSGVPGTDSPDVGLHGLGETAAGDEPSHASDAFWRQVETDGPAVLNHLLPSLSQAGGGAGGERKVEGSVPLSPRTSQFIDAMVRRPRVRKVPRSTQTEGDAQASPAWEQQLSCLYADLERARTRCGQVDVCVHVYTCVCIYLPVYVSKYACTHV